MAKRSPFKQGLYGGLAVIAIGALILVIGVVAAQFEFNSEDAIDDSQADPAVGRVGDPASPDAPDSSSSLSLVLHVYASSITCSGAGPAGYGRAGMYDACRLEDPNSHFCNLQEIETAWKTNGLNLILTGQAWIDNAVVGTVDPGYAGDFAAVSDWYGGNAVGDHPYNCLAWTSSANGARGLILNSGSISPAVEACDDVHPVACCKRVITHWLRLPLIIR
jgi:hypothetical protein